jgi:hypothetical protein
MSQPSISLALLNRILSTSRRPDYQWFAAFRLSAVHLDDAIRAIRQTRCGAPATTQSDIISRLDQISDELNAIVARCNGETLGSVPALSRTQDLICDLRALQQEVIKIDDRLRRCGNRG